MIFLVDYNLDGYAPVFLGILTKNGWFELLPIRFVTLGEAELSILIPIHFNFVRNEFH